MPRGKSFKKINKGDIGHPLKLDEKFIERMVNTIRIGAYTETAAIMAGASKDSFYQWIKQAHADTKEGLVNTIFQKLLAAVEKAHEEATVRDLQNIDKCAMGQEPIYMKDVDGGIVYTENGKPIILKVGHNPDWGASAWRLERRRPKEWGRTEKLEVTGKDGGPVETSVETPEEKAERKKRISENLKKLSLMNGN